MRILFAVHGYQPAYRIGGPIYPVSALARGLRRRGHQVVVFTTNSNLDEDLDVPVDVPVDVDGVEVWYFRRAAILKETLPFLSYVAKSLGYLYAPRMRQELDRVAPGVDLIHTHMPFNYPNMAAARAAFRHNKPLFYHQRGVLDPARLKFRSLKKLPYVWAVEKPIMRRATTLIALTEDEQRSYRALGISTRCEVIPNGIHAVPGLESVPPNAALAALPADALVILFMGRIHPIKGTDALLEAFFLISGKIPRAVLVLSGPDEFGLEVRYRAEIRKRDLSNRVQFTGMVSGSHKKWLLERANVFCLPSVAEGFSIAVLEALVSGTPVLLSPGCHFPEVAVAGVGRVAERTPVAIADALLELLSDPARLKLMGDKATRFVARYDWDRIVDQLLTVYEEGISRHHKAVRSR